MCWKTRRDCSRGTERQRLLTVWEVDAVEIIIELWRTIKPTAKTMSTSLFYSAVFYLSVRLTNVSIQTVAPECIHALQPLRVYVEEVFHVLAATFVPLCAILFPVLLFLTISIDAIDGWLSDREIEVGWLGGTRRDRCPSLLVVGHLNNLMLAIQLLAFCLIWYEALFESEAHPWLLGLGILDISNGILFIVFGSIYIFSIFIASLSSISNGLR